MSVTRDRRNGTWYVQAWYKTYDGKRAHKVKRGFKTKPEALAWERDFYAVQAGVFGQVFLSEMGMAFFRVRSRNFFGFRHGHAASFPICPT